MRRLVMSRLIWIYTVCKGICFGIQGERFVLILIIAYLLRTKKQTKVPPSPKPVSARSIMRAVKLGAHVWATPVTASMAIQIKKLVFLPILQRTTLIADFIRKLGSLNIFYH